MQIYGHALEYGDILIDIIDDMIMNGKIDELEEIIRNKISFNSIEENFIKLYCREDMLTFGEIGKLLFAESKDEAPVVCQCIYKGILKKIFSSKEFKEKLCNLVTSSERYKKRWEEISPEELSVVTENLRKQKKGEKIDNSGLTINGKNIYKMLQIINFIRNNLSIEGEGLQEHYGIGEDTVVVTRIPKKCRMFWNTFFVYDPYNSYDNEKKENIEMQYMVGKCIGAKAPNEIKKACDIEYEFDDRGRVTSLTAYYIVITLNEKFISNIIKVNIDLKKDIERKSLSITEIGESALQGKKAEDLMNVARQERARQEAKKELPKTRGE